MKGKIIAVTKNRKTFRILGEDGQVYTTVPRHIDVPGKHTCLVEIGDLMEFQPSSDDNLAREVRFADPPEITLQEWEISTVAVTETGGDILFCNRIDPSCGCSIGIGPRHLFPHLKYGDFIRHRLGLYHAHIIAADIEKLSQSEIDALYEQQEN